MSSLQLQTAFLSSLAFSLALTPLFAWAAERIGAVDRPVHRKTHSRPVPYLGGVALFASILAAFALVTSLRPDLTEYLGGPSFRKGLFILTCTLGVAAVGLLDDLRDLPARYKFAGQSLFVMAFVLLGFRFEVLHLPGLPPVELSYLSVPLTVFWMLAVINAFNMVDGLDGLATTVSVVSLALLATGCAMVDNLTGLLLALAALGAVLGFLPYNWKPAKVYLGDAGSGGLGMFLAASLVAMGKTHGEPLPTGQPFHYQVLIATLVVAYPALEILLSVTRRLLHGRSIARGDQGHIHHRLLKTGWSTPYICLAAFVIGLLPGLAALAIIVKQHGWATWLLAISGIVFGLGLSSLGFLDFLRPKVVERLRPHFRIAHHFVSMQRIKLGLARTREEVLTLVNQACQELGVDSYHLIISSDGQRMGGLDYVHQWDPIKQSTDRHTHDHLRLSRNRGGAQWVFEPHSEEQEELDMEYRVLISELMREALEAAWRLGRHEETIEVPSVANLSPRAVSGHHLRKRASHRLEPKKR